MDSRKSNKIRDIVRLQQIIKKWRKLASSPKSGNATNSSSNGSGNKSIKFLKRTLSLSDHTSLREGSSNTVRKGYLALSVGEEQKRFVIPTEYLSLQAFHILLQEAEEEFGFQQAGVLRIPCEVSVFENILKVVEEKKEINFTQEKRLSMEEMAGSSCSSESQLANYSKSHHPQSPMCR